MLCWGLQGGWFGWEAEPEAWSGVYIRHRATTLSTVSPVQVLKHVVRSQLGGGAGAGAGMEVEEDEEAEDARLEGLERDCLSRLHLLRPHNSLGLVAAAAQLEPLLARCEQVGGCACGCVYAGCRGPGDSWRTAVHVRMERQEAHEGRGMVWCGVAACWWDQGLQGRSRLDVLTSGRPPSHQAQAVLGPTPTPLTRPPHPSCAGGRALPAAAAGRRRRVPLAGEGTQGGGLHAPGPGPRAPGLGPGPPAARGSHTRPWDRARPRSVWCFCPGRPGLHPGAHALVAGQHRPGAHPGRSSCGGRVAGRCGPRAEAGAGWRRGQRQRQQPVPRAVAAPRGRRARRRAGPRQRPLAVRHGGGAPRGAAGASGTALWPPGAGCRGGCHSRCGCLLGVGGCWLGLKGIPETQK